MTRGYLQGKKVALRAFGRGDLPAYRRWLDEPRVTEYLEMGWRPTRDSDVEAWWKLADETPDAVVFAIVDARKGKAVGTCGLYAISWIARRAQFNILIGEPTAWDKGFGTEALSLLLAYGFDVLNLESINLGVNADNKRAVRSYEKAGFAVEGVRRKFVYRNGRYYDSIMMSVLREEYRTRRGKKS
jgi:RimJ/RimL family protein N-acetyltransferase